MRGLGYADKVAVITGGGSGIAIMQKWVPKRSGPPWLFIESEATCTTGVDHLISGGAELRSREPRVKGSIIHRVRNHGPYVYVL